MSKCNHLALERLGSSPIIEPTIFLDIAPNMISAWTQDNSKVYSQFIPSNRKSVLHNIIQIHNNVMWNWQYST